MTGARPPVDVDRYIAETGAAVSAYLATVFPADAQPARLFEAMNYSLLAGGKRIRPILCLAAARSFGVREEDAMPAAAALELVHTYSLIHDDLPAMDDDDLRRGRPTNHRVFGEATALLAGDGLLTEAFALLSQPLNVPPERQLQMIQTLARAAGPYGMVGGQQADMEANRTTGSLDQLAFIHRRKTGMLIQASVVIGGLFAALGPAEREALAAFGIEIGHAFQIVDDWLDVSGDTEALGKQTGADERMQKLTYPSLIGLERTRQLAEERYEAAVSALEAAGIDAPLLTGLAAYVVQRNR
ncbi:polyprenyl synthetase family protein [Alicyclobacillus macrosporangiidus]|jgi:geranylgeranyl diphosphate synthase type II|uniref:Farnesyl diphosphate synthase n=1 Tax=Alicyclobacillus macrosporangiidus TaxID=392015 RepID=A0A1I7JY13_9BACL|nr:farnesyl diphosphate synthase [Alicyclobacillus macrosporangiidus]SFU90066.1 geranylgeranyl diphosphate synthase, type II [Alicyclobacillus macrosporangiidus]